MLQRIICIAATFGSLATASLAQPQKTVCEDGVWNPLKEPDIAARNLTRRVAVFNDAVQAALKGFDGRKIVVVVADCPVFGYAIRAIKLHNGMSAGIVSIPPTYGIYVTAAYIRNTDEDDLPRKARRQVCIIRSGVVENTQRPPDGPDEPPLKKCMLESAIAVGDMDYARVLAQQLGVAMPERRSGLRENHFGIQRGIDRLRALPSDHPALQGIKTLEDLQRSLKEFPPLQ
ncbi:MAG: hypothetical protein RLZZ416_786 [Candidatus Parcubacteria bacterium]|jgi:hypothetical protein